MVGMRGAVSPKAGLFKKAAQEIRDILKAEGVADMPLGIDVVEPPFLFALQDAGLEVRDGQQVMLEARMLKSQDELTLLNMAAAMVDGVYQDIFEALKPGVRENEIVALATKRLYEMGSDSVEAINAISGERCSPHPHNFTDRIIRPGDQAFFDIIMSFIGYRTCYYRTFSVGRATKPQVSAYKKAREWMDEAIALIKPGVTTDKIARAFPKAQEIGFESEMAAFGLNFCHGIGLGLHERPIISRLNSFDDPMELAGRDDVRRRDVLPGHRRRVGGAHRGGGHRHAGRRADHHAVPGRRASDRQPVLRLPHHSANAPRARRAGDAAGAGGMGPLTTADFVPVTRGAVPTPWPLCRRRAEPEGLSGPIPPAPASSPARSPSCAHSE